MQEIVSISQNLTCWMFGFSPDEGGRLEIGMGSFIPFEDL